MVLFEAEIPFIALPNELFNKLFLIFLMHQPFRPSNLGNISLQLVPQQCCKLQVESIFSCITPDVVSCDKMLLKVELV